jgi:hypothetical protein
MKTASSPPRKGREEMPGTTADWKKLKPTIRPDLLRLGQPRSEKVLYRKGSIF